LNNSNFCSLQASSDSLKKSLQKNVSHRFLNVCQQKASKYLSTITSCCRFQLTFEKDTNCYNHSESQLLTIIISQMHYWNTKHSTFLLFMRI